MVGYIHDRSSETKELIRFHYTDQEDLFDDVSYRKGGLVLRMLNNYLGDSAFCKGLNLYLTRNKFKPVEAHQLRLAMEEVSGQDLNWFFNQWYFGSGQPKVTIDYLYDDVAHKVSVIVTQTQGAQHLFKIALTIDVYTGENKISYPVWISNERDSFTFDYASRPDLVNVDAAKVVLWDKTDNKTTGNYIFQYNHAGNYCDRREAIAACAKHQSEQQALDLLLEALKDRYDGLRFFTLGQLNMKSDTVKQIVEPILLNMAKADMKSTVRAKAIELLGTYRKKEYQDVFAANLTDSSYAVAGAALTALAAVDSSAALAEARRQMAFKSKGKLADAVLNTLMLYGSEDQFDFIYSGYPDLPYIFPDKINSTVYFVRYLAKVRSTERLKKAIDTIFSFRNTFPQMLSKRIDPALSALAGQKEAEGLKDQADYINTFHSFSK
jgi:aminopeptidase N